MKATDLINARTEEFETVETFAKRVFDTAKRVTRGTMNLDLRATYEVISRLSKYYIESTGDIRSAINSLSTSTKYQIFFYNCLGELLLTVQKR